MPTVSAQVLGERIVEERGTFLLGEEWWPTRAAHGSPQAFGKGGRLRADFEAPAAPFTIKGRYS